MNKRLVATIAATILVSSYAYPETLTSPLQLASSYNIGQDSIDLESYWVSEKLDGIRARWTGSQLLTRNGNLIYTPDWFTENWPNVALDGELWIARGKFEETASIVLSHTPDERWSKITFKVFDSPDSQATFDSRLSELRLLSNSLQTNTLSLVSQHLYSSLEDLNLALDKVVVSGGEGLMLHHKHARYIHGRSDRLLKLKKFDDDEARVIGHISGKGKFSDVMGALLVQTKDGVIFKLGSGFSDEERENPPPIDSWVTYKYYGKTRHGKPRFASYLRTRPLLDLTN